MRKTLILVGIPVAVVGVAIAIAIAKYGSGTKPTDKFASDLQQAQAVGLDLAQAQGANKYALTEIPSASKPMPAKAVRQGSGTKAIRSKTPTVKAAPEPVAAQVVEDVPEVQVTQTAPSPAPTGIPQSTQAPGSDQGPILAGGSGRTTGRTGSGSGSGSGGVIGSIIGGIFGSILRGGPVDGDNCDPRGGARRPAGRPVYTPNPRGLITGGTIQFGMPSSGPVFARPRGGPR